MGIEQRAVVVVGSQAILRTHTEDQLPPETTMSVEVDMLPIADDNDETARLADLIEGVAGEWSPLEEQHGFNIDDVDRSTAVLPDGWRDRLAKVSNANTASRRTRTRLAPGQTLRLGPYGYSSATRPTSRTRPLHRPVTATAVAPL